MAILADPRQRSRGWPEVAAGAVVALPVLVDVARHGPARLFAWTAADAFYYLQVARNWGRDGSVSFDGSRGTNGFHPLWQGSEAALVFVADHLGLSDVAVLRLVVVLQALMLAVAVWLLGRAVRIGRQGRLGWWWAAVPVGVYAVLLAPVWVAEGALGARGRNPLEGDMPLYGTWWSYVNGMETPVVLLAFAGLALFAVRSPLQRARSGAALGGVAVVLTLGRLDVGGVALGTLAVLALAAWRTGDRIRLRAMAVAGATFAVVFGAYLLWNLSYAGVMLPVSGTLKSTFPHPTLGNWRDLRSLVFGGNHTFASLRTYRLFPTVVPGLVAAAHLALSGPVAWRRREAGTLDDPSERWRLILIGTALGVLALAGYDFFFVPGNHQGHWYWPVSTTYVTLAAVAAVDAVLRRRAPADGTARWSGPRLAPLRAGFAVAVVLSSLAFFVAFARPDGYHRRFAAFALEEAPRVQRHYAGRDLRILAIDDGIDAWALDVPAMAGTGLTLDRAGVAAVEEGNLLGLALDRGFDRISTVQYLNANGLDRDSTSDEIADRLAEILPGQDLTPYRFSIDYVSGPLPTSRDDDAGRYVIIAFRRAATG